MFPGSAGHTTGYYCMDFLYFISDVVLAIFTSTFTVNKLKFANAGRYYNGVYGVMYI